MLLTVMLPMACSVNFLVQIKTTSSGVPLPVLGLSYQSLIKKMSHKLAFKSGGDSLSGVKFIFPEDSSFCVNLTKIKSNQHECGGSNRV